MWLCVLRPLPQEDAREMLHELKSFALLSGARGKQAVDENALLEALGRLSQLATDFPQISELDLNPLLVYPGGIPALAVDARLSL